MNIPHPKMPLHKELTAALLECTTPGEILAVRRKFNERRNQEFPFWREKYDAEVDAWAAANGAGRIATPTKSRSMGGVI